MQINGTDQLANHDQSREGHDLRQGRINGEYRHDLRLVARVWSS